MLKPPIYTDTTRFLGDPSTPREIQYQRRSTGEALRYLGTPVLVKRMYTAEDMANGLALDTALDSRYQQARYACDLLSHGVGYVSVETQSGEWYDPLTENVYIAPENPHESYLPAPTYRGYGPGIITYAIFSDRPEDQWKLTEAGAMIRTQTAMIQLPWWPQVGDNDVIVMVTLDQNGRIKDTQERYQLKQVSPVTMHGIDRLGRRETLATANNNRFWVGQSAELVKVPDRANDQIYRIEVDR